MIHNCERCKEPVKKVGRLKKISIGNITFRFCKKCENEIEMKRNINTFLDEYV